MQNSFPHEAPLPAPPLAGILSPPNAAAPQSFEFVTQRVTPGARVSTQSRPWPTGTALVGQAALYPAGLRLGPRHRGPP